MTSSQTEKLLLSAFVGVESAHAFSAFNPSIFTIRSLAIPQGAESQIRIGYIPSVGFSIILGAIVGKIIHSKMPLLFGLGTSSFMVAVYEVALRVPIAPSTKLLNQNNNKLENQITKGRYTILS